MKGVYARPGKAQTTSRLAILTGLQAKPLPEKISISRAIIHEALSCGTPVVLYSGGRDSTVLMDLVLQEAPTALLMHNRTGLEDPGSLQAMRAFLQSHVPGANYLETEARDPEEMWQEKGYFPILSKRGFTAYKKRDPGLRISPVQCCYQLKEREANRAMQAAGVRVAFWGNRASESMRRRLTFVDNGYLFKPKKYIWHQAYPLQHWHQADIDRYLLDNVPGYPEPGSSFETGCRPCGTDITFWPNNLGRLYQQDPGAWEHYMRLGFAEQIMRIKGIQGRPGEVITHQPHLLLRINQRHRAGKG